MFLCILKKGAFSNGSIEKQIREIEASISAKRIRIQELEEKLRTIEMERQRLEKTRMVRMMNNSSQLRGSNSGRHIQNFVPISWINAN